MTAPATINRDVQVAKVKLARLVLLRHASTDSIEIPVDHVQAGQADEGAAIGLLALMRGLSEEHWLAGWMGGLESMLWNCAISLPWLGFRRFGAGRITTRQMRMLWDLAHECDGWWVWDDDAGGPAFVRMEAWLTYSEQVKTLLEEDDMPDRTTRAADSQIYGAQPRPRITLIRELRGLSQSELAAMLGIGEDVIAEIEAGGRALNFDLLVAISRELDVRPADILGSSPPTAHTTSSATVRVDIPADPQIRDAIIRDLTARWAADGGNRL